MAPTTVAFLVFAVCLLIVLIHYCFFSRNAYGTERYIRERERSRTTRPFGARLRLIESDASQPPSPPTKNDNVDDQRNNSSDVARPKRFARETIDDDDDGSIVDDESPMNDENIDGGDAKISPPPPPPPPSPPLHSSGRKDDGRGNDAPRPDYPNPITVMEPLVKTPEGLTSYTLMDDESDGGGGGGTTLHDSWLRDEREFAAMFTFQHRVLRYVATERNNAIATIDAYVRSVAVLRDFAQRFLNTLGAVTSAPGPPFEDWRMYVTVSAAHFAQCLYFVRDESVRGVCRRCVNILIGDPYTVLGRERENVDPPTAYRLANIWIMARRADGRDDWASDRHYNEMLGTLPDKKLPMRQWLYYEPPLVDQVLRTRDHGRLLQARIPFYGDLWHRYVYIRNVRKMDERVNALVANTPDFECLRVFVHAQVRYTAFGLFGPGAVVPSYWLWPITDVGLRAVPSIGFLRMYAQRYSWSCRVLKEDMPFYTYRPGRFDLRHMHLFSQNRMFVLLGDNDVASRVAFQPGSIVLEGESEAWVLDNCRAVREAGGLVALYPLRASGSVMATSSVGVAVQRYEMFRGLTVEEWVLLDVHHKRVFTHTVVRNDTDRPAGYHTSGRVDGTVHRVPPGATVTVYAYADFDDRQLTTRILCHPMDIQAFFGQSQEATVYTSFLENGRIHYALSAEDGVDHVYVISRDDMVDMPERLTVRQREYRFDAAFNQYVHVTPRIKPHTALLTTSAVADETNAADGERRSGDGSTATTVNPLRCDSGECRGFRGLAARDIGRSPAAATRQPTVILV